ncbi:552_t:CDS:2 [Paraglomus occultum]|uniref:552_t:CDS:1 n=1 Tax=Paraglomus occultum TaxID=144539 RepID=A0A9N9AW82_9GLOM|nr:552_t:CDS:2 [Paraglomus occultum]
MSALATEGRSIRLQKLFLDFPVQRFRSKVLPPRREQLATDNSSDVTVPSVVPAIKQDSISEIIKNEQRDVRIEVGEGEDTRTFMVHSKVLMGKAEYFEKAFSNRWVRIEDGVKVFKKKFITPAAFEVIIDYFYENKISPNNLSSEATMALLLSADEMCLPILHEIQVCLIKLHSDYLNSQFAYIYSISRDREEFALIQDYCHRTIKVTPEVVFTSNDFMDTEEDVIIEALNARNYVFDEGKVWDMVLDWGINQMLAIMEDEDGEEGGVSINIKRNTVNTFSPRHQIQHWTLHHFSMLSSILSRILPHFRYGEFSKKDFMSKVYPFKQIFPYSMIQDIMGNYKYPQYIPRMPSARPRLLLSDMHLSWLSHTIASETEIDQAQLDSYRTYPRKARHHFRLLLRGTRDGFSSRTFHYRCDERGPTLTLVKPYGTNDIIGGYVSISWLSDCKYHAADSSFLFSIKNERLTLSRNKLSERVMWASLTCGPSFGDEELHLWRDKSTQAFAKCSNKNTVFEKSIGMNGVFAVEEYEVLGLSKLW